MKLYAPVATALGNDTTLSASLTNSATTASFTSTALLPTAGFSSIVRIDNEVILVTGGSGNPYTITRAYEGTTAAAHASGAGVNHVVTPVAVRAAASPITTLGTTGTVTIDASLGDIFTARLTGNTTFAAPTNPTNGQRITLCIEQDSTPGHTITYNDAFTFNGSVPSRVPSGWDTSMALVQEFVYNSTNSRWDCISAVLHGGSIASQILSDSPLAYWKLTETSGSTATDSSGNGHNGTYEGSPTLASTGVTLNGTSQYISFGGTTLSTWGLGDTFTAEGWYYPDGTAKQHIFGGSTSSSSLHVYLDTTSKQFRVGEYVSSINYDFATESSPYAFASGTWHHWAVTKNGAAIKAYIDGTELTITGSNRTVGWGYGFAIGYLGTTPIAGYAKGQMHDIALYTTVLPASRIAAHYEAGS